MKKNYNELAKKFVSLNIYVYLQRNNITNAINPKTILNNCISISIYYMSLLRKTSLKDIAEAAGVSTALVSFVLNGKEKEYRVGEKTAQRILKIANEMNYQPNLAAKSLRSGKTKTIGLVVSDISNPFFPN